MVSRRDFSNPQRACAKGIKISPFLFIIMAKALGRAIKSRYASKNLEGIKITTNFVAIHQKFVDDNHLLGIAKPKEEA